MIKDMKCLHEGEICEVISIDYLHGYADLVEKMIKEDMFHVVKLEEAVWLPCFPETDKEGSKCWSGDLILDWGNEENYLLWFDGYEWGVINITCDEISMDNFKTFSGMKDRDVHYFAKTTYRLVSAFEPEALNCIDQQTQTDIIKMMER